MIDVEIIAIGNEILAGDVLDTNTNWLCKRITALGGSVAHASIVRDDLDDIARELRESIARHPALIITTGGLGPTADDMTLAAVAKAVGAPLTLNSEALDMVRQKYEELARAGYVADAHITPAREKTARLPKGAIPLGNPVGAAPGVSLTAGDVRIVSLPGVPAELKGIFESSLKPILKEIFGKGGYHQVLLVLDCNDESILAPVLEATARDHPRVYVKSRARRFGPEYKIRLTLSATGENEEEAVRAVDDALKSLRDYLNSAGISIESVEEG
ncbi:MAG: competence/damage-inducible protein A [bacterium]